MMIESFSDLEKIARNDTVGACFVDTSVLFSATYPLDFFNESCENLFSIFADQNIPLFLNVNVRAEFLENHRRILIAESLIDFLEDSEDRVEGPLAEKLKSHRTSYRRKVAEERASRIELQQLKIIRGLLSDYVTPSGRNGWNSFCKSYLEGKIESIWQSADRVFNLNLISLSHGNSADPHLNILPEWETATRLMEDHGMSSADAMILNMFLCSKVPILLTADLEMAAAAAKETDRQKIFVPDFLIMNGTLKKP